MRKSLPLLVAGALALSMSTAQARTDPEAQIARITEGRTAGKPVDCIFPAMISSTQIISRTAIVYRMNNGTIYVNRPASGASFLRPGDVLVTDTRTPRLCNVDIVRLVDSGNFMPTGSVGLGDFVPYAAPPRGAAR